jgi:hypothetical protein
VIVEVIAGQIREERDVEFHAVDAALVESVRRHLHRDGRGACGVKLLQHFLQDRDIGGGV